MARENYVLLYGMVERNPDITVDEDAQYKKGKIILRTARKSFATEDNRFLQGEIRWDGPCIYSKRSDLIRKVFTKIRAGDMLLVKGNLCTQEVTRRATCPKCGNIVRKPGGVITYIDPICIYIEQLGEVSFEEYCEERSLNPEEIALLRKTGLIGITEEQAVEMMQRKVEISNQVYLDGELCREPTVYEDTINHHTQTQFQIAVNRKRYIREDNPDKRTDYIWIKAYGRLAKEYQEVLHLHSKITVNGALQTRKVNIDFFCDRCGEVFQKANLSQEVVPYSIEYREDCDIPEEKERDSYEEEE